MRDSIQIIPSKHSNSVSFLPLYCMFYITFISVLIHSLILNLRHLILTTFYLRKRPHIHLPPLYLRHFHFLHFFFFFIPSKNIYNSSNNHNRVMYKSYKFDLASPSIDHSIKFSDSLWYAKGISIEVLLNICVSTFLRVIHLNIYIISTICNVFQFVPIEMIA